jgi:hypothetical protein
MDYFKPVISNDKAIENCMTLFQGIPNSRHVLQLVKTGEHPPTISEIRIYKPYFNK